MRQSLNLFFQIFSNMYLHNAQICIFKYVFSNVYFQICIFKYVFSNMIWDLDSKFLQHYGESANNVCTSNVTGQKSRAKVGHPFANLKGKGKKGSQSWFWVPRKLAALEMTTTFPFAFNLHQINLKSLLNSIRTKPLVNPIPST